MAVLVYLGHGVVDAVIALALLAYGMVARDRRMRRAGLAAFLAVVVSGVAADLLKLAFQMPRPVVRGSYGFPSGHTTTAFALAGTLGLIFPTAAPFLYLLALIAGAARLYERSHFVIDVIGGAVVGTGSGLLIGRRLLAPFEPRRTTSRTRWAWALLVVAGIPALVFFAAYEHAVQARRPAGAPRNETPSSQIAVTFGTLESRPLLLEGWSEAQHRPGTFPRVWAEGLESTLRLPALTPMDHRIRFKARPHVERGRRAPCQVVEVALNGVPVGRVLLEKDWNEYELKVPKALIGRGGNEIRFRFAYAEPLGPGGADGTSGDGRAVSAAFASLEVFAERK